MSDSTGGRLLISIFFILSLFCALAAQIAFAQTETEIVDGITWKYFVSKGVTSLMTRAGAYSGSTAGIVGTVAGSFVGVCYWLLD